MSPSSRAARRIFAVIPWVLVVVLAALNVLAMSRLGPNDDAYITYRVARNLANGIGPVFNPGERVLTVTTPGYMLLLAAASGFTNDFVLLGLLLNGLALLAIGALLIDLSSAIQSDRPAADPTGLGAALSATLAVGITLTFPLLSAAIGMETPLFLAAVLATFAAYRRALLASHDHPLETRWLLWTAVAAALAFLLRPDGLLVGVAIGLHWLAARRRIPWTPLAMFVIISAPWQVFAWSYYGSPVPNTLAAKATQALGEAVPRWGPGLAQAAGHWAQQFPVAAILAAIGLILALARRQPDRLPLLLWAALAIVMHTLLGVRSYFWYYVPFAPVLGLLAGDAAGAGVHWLGQRRPGKLASGLAATALALAALVPAATAAAALAEPPVARRREQAYLHSATILRELCSDGQGALSVGVAEIGLIGYESDCPIVDFAGLLQRDVAHLRVSAAEKMTWAIRRYQPDLIILSGGSGYPTVVSDAAWFRERYEGVDQITMDGYRSVIYRRALGPEAQRDLPDAGWWRSAEPSRAIEQTLYFAPNASPAITLHVFLPSESSLSVDANGRRVETATGDRLAWQDVSLPGMAPAGRVDLSITGSAGDQAAAVAWIDSNALPSVHYFVPLGDASTRPRPTAPLDPGASLGAQLARPSQAPVALELLFRDRPGVRLDVFVNGEPRGTVGGTDAWRVDQFPLPDSPVFTVELRNQSDAPVRISHIALVEPVDAEAGK